MWEFSLDKGWRSVGDLLREVSPDSQFTAEQIEKAGFGLRPESQMGLVEMDFFAEIYRSDTHAKYKYLVMVEVGGIIQQVWLPDFPSLIELLSKISPIAQAAIARVEFESNLKTQ